MLFNMGMKKEKSSSEVYPADDADCGSLQAENVVCYKSYISARQSDSSARMNNAVVCPSGSSESCGTSNNASKDEMLLESNARELVTENQHPSKLAHTSQGNLTCSKHIGPNKNGEVSASSAAGTCNHEEKVQGIIDQIPSCSLDLEADAAMDAADPLLGIKVNHVDSNSQASANGQTGENDVDGKQSIDSLSSLSPDEKPQLIDANKHLIALPESEGDDADLEEQDVKICDICGDAGREDLLAVCSRCSDGAEHTYCMREMLDEVPEGDWLCEECKSYEEMERRRQGRSEILGGKERSKRILDNLEKKDRSLAGTREKNDSLSRRLTNKRRGSDIELDPTAKKQVLESMVQSPHSPSISSPPRDGALSRDNSFKSRDEMSTKLTHQASISGRDNLEKPRSPNTSLSNVAKGSYLKSNSFGASSSVPKDKLVEIPQKRKQCDDVKDASSKIISKSVSFKGNLGRSNTTETKVKMLSPKDSHILESRALKQAKDRTLFERKNSIKLDQSAASQLALNGCKNQLRGENRRQQSAYSSGTDSASGSADVKSSLSNKEGCTSSFSRLDGNNSEKTLDRSSNHPRQYVEDATMQSSALDTSSVRSLKDGVNEENKLKAAIQAAMQKRLDMGKRSKGHDKSNVVSVSNVDSVGEKATLDRTSVNNVNQSKVLSADSGDSFQAKKIDSVSSYPGQILKRSAIPDHEFAWIGSFEVCRGESTPEQIYGVQAHLSNCASYKVLEMVKKFPQKVSLSEVPRSCTWPAQFLDGGVEEDNIAVYFFAKDVESYERSYKNLLEKLMKDDLALKGNIDGIDLLIFPSKQLAKKSQRWNMLFFIWGVFRGKKENCLDDNPGYKSTCKAVTSDFRSPLEKPSLDGHAKENISTTKSEQDLRDHSSFDSGAVLRKESPKFSNGNDYSGENSEHKTNSHVMKNRNEEDSACGHPEASCGTRYESTLVQVDYVGRNTVKVAESQTIISRGEGCLDSSAKVEIMSAVLSPVEKSTDVKVKVEKSEEATVKARGCPTKLKEELKCKEDENQAKVIIEGKLKQDEVNMKQIDFGGNTSAGLQKQPLKDMKMDFDDEESAKERVGSTESEKRSKLVPDKEADRFHFPLNLNASSSTSTKSRADTMCSSSKAADGFPNLELALGVENRRAKSGFCLEVLDAHRGGEPNVGRENEDEESSAAALSLSLAFPLKERDRSAPGEFPGK